MGSPLLFAAEPPWPPIQETVTLNTPDFLKVPASVATKLAEGKIVPFEVAKEPPSVELAFHAQLGTDSIHRRLWSSWGDICVAGDGRVYCAIGDHGNDLGGDARCFLYRWDPATKKLSQIVDMDRIVPPRPGQPAWSKVHARIDEGPDGKIYFTCTLNDGARAADPKYAFNDTLPGGQLYRFDPTSGSAEVFANLPPRRCTATSLLDRKRNVWWCNLEVPKGDSLYGIDLASKQVVYRGAEGSVGFNRAFALLRDGGILFNGPTEWQRLDPKAGTIRGTGVQAEGSPGIRAATRESSGGHVFGVTHKTNQIFDYTVSNNALKLLGPTWLEGEYTAVCELSPDERFLYYLPGSHGRAWESGTPVIQYDLTTGRRKVLAFLAPAFERAHAYVPGGTYGMKISADGSTLYVNFNGHAADGIRPSNMKPIGFGLTAFAAIHIHSSER